MNEINLLLSLEEKCRETPDDPCFFIAGESDVEDGEYKTVSYSQLRNRSLHLARSLYDGGLERGMWCVSNMGNCPEFIYLAIAAAIGGFKVAVVNSQLTEEERQIRIKEAANLAGTGNIKVLTADSVNKYIDADIANFGEIIDDAPDLLNRSAEAFIPEVDALAVFSTGPYGRPHPVIFSWSNMLGAARAVNITVSQPGQGLWQLAMPLHRVAGLQILFRSLLNKSSFILYRSYDVQRILDDAIRLDTTHVSIWGSSLQDMLDLVPEGSPNALAFKGYECIMLGGSNPDTKLLKKASQMGARIYACFGMTETSGNIAACLVSDSYDGKVFSLPGYQFAIIAPDKTTGYGQLAVKGPGVVSKSSNPQTVFTADNYLLTGFLARIDDSGVRVLRGTSDSFVSKGEDVDPKEIQKRLLQVPGVTDSYVFADENDEWGRRPAAIVEVAGVSRETGVNLQDLAKEVGVSLANKLAPMLRPERIIAVPGFPRLFDGQADHAQLRLLFDQRIDVRKVEAWIVAIPQDPPLFVGSVKLKERKYLTVRVTDWKGKTGIGECLALPETCHPTQSLEGASSYLRTVVAPLVKSYAYVHPSQVSVIIRSLQDSKSQSLACSALSNAIWDLYGKITSASISQLIGANGVSDEASLRKIPPGCVPCGSVVGGKSEQEILDKIREKVDVGCQRIRLRIRPGNDVSLIDSIRQAYPNLALVLDAGMSYNESNIDSLCHLDASGIECIVDPFDPSYKPKVGPQRIWERLVRLQKSLSIPICIDDTWHEPSELHHVLAEYPALRCVALKLGKMGGVQPALEFYWQARERGISLWMASDGGTTISSRLQAAFCMLPGMNIIGDLPIPTEESTDACDPPLSYEDCCLLVNPESDPFGLGCHLSDEKLENLAEFAWEA